MSNALEQSFVAQLKENQNIIHKICRLYTQGEDAHNDLFQEITIQLWKAFPKFRGDSKFSTWAYRVALNTAITLYRKSTKTVNTIEFETAKHFVSQEEYNYEEEEHIKLLYKAVQQLNDIEKALVFMYLEDKDYTEISETLGISEVNARVKMNRIKTKLKKLLIRNGQGNMEELDLLKRDWNKKDNFPDVSEDKIYGMLHKNSSSTVKWIFIISIIELSLGIVLSIGMSFTKFDEENMQFLKSIGVYVYYEIFMVLLYVVIIYFIIRFYSMYKKVSTTDNTKQLMNNILKTRKTVQNYILFNLVAFAIGFIALLAYGLKFNVDKAAIETTGKMAEIPTSLYAVTFLAILVITGVLTGAFWLIYRLIYGILLKKLKKNFEELKKIDL